MDGQVQFSRHYNAFESPVLHPLPLTCIPPPAPHLYSATCPSFVYPPCPPPSALLVPLPPALPPAPPPAPFEPSTPPQ